MVSLDALLLPRVVLIDVIHTFGNQSKAKLIVTVFVQYCYVNELMSTATGWLLRGSVAVLLRGDVFWALVPAGHRGF